MTGTEPASNRAGRIRVARIITRLNVGGPAIQALLLTTDLDPGRYETLLVCGTPGPREGDIRDLRPTSAAPIVVATLGREISPLADMLSLITLVRVLRRWRPDIVHTHLAKAGLLGRIAARIAGVPVVVHTFHGNVLSGYFDPLRARLFLWLERWLARLSTRVIAISPSQRAELLRLRIAEERAIVEIPLGFDLAPFATAARGSLRRELGVAPQTPLVGIVARLVPIKAVEDFISAAARVLEARPDARFLVIGDGPERKRLERRARELSLAKSLQFLGWRGDLPSIYADLDVVALTSRNEGTPVSVIEALAAGCAVCATRVGGVVDVVGEPPAAILVPAGAVDALAEATVRLLADPGLRRLLGERGRARVLAKHDRTTLLRSVDDLYRSLVPMRR